MVGTVFQFAYTTLFGWYASYLFLRTGPSPLLSPSHTLTNDCTGSIIPPILAHIFCNYMGLPPIAWALSVFPSRRLCTVISSFSLSRTDE
jgi:prenyl protein peptidase